MNSECQIQPPVSRFSNRAENYMRYRPPYPPEIVPFLEKTMGLRGGHNIADIGSGTGLFAELFLRRGYSVTCIEPDEAMRSTAEKRLSTYTGYRSIQSRSEQTWLANKSVDLITVAHALSWMELELSKKEFDRILKPGGKIVVAGNFRRTHTPFLAAYDGLKKTFREEQPNPSEPEELVHAFFTPKVVNTHSFQHTSWHDFDSLKGLLLSSPGIPLPGSPLYETLISGLVQLFVAFNQNGFVHMEYDTRIYWT